MRPSLADLQKKYGNFNEDGYAKTFSTVFEEAVYIIRNGSSNPYKPFFENEQGVTVFNTVIKTYAVALAAPFETPAPTDVNRLEQQLKTAPSAGAFEPPPPEPSKLAAIGMGDVPMGDVAMVATSGGTTKKKKNLKKKKKSIKAKKKRKNNIKSKRKLKLMKKTIKVKN